MPPSPLVPLFLFPLIFYAIRKHAFSYTLNLNVDNAIEHHENRVEHKLANFPLYVYNKLGKFERGTIAFHGLLRMGSSKAKSATYAIMVILYKKKKKKKKRYTCICAVAIVTIIIHFLYFVDTNYKASLRLIHFY